MFAASDWWRVEPDVGRVAHGVPARMDRLRALGNAVVPQIPMLIGSFIRQYEEAAYEPPQAYIAQDSAIVVDRINKGQVLRRSRRSDETDGADPLGIVDKQIQITGL